LVSRIYTAFGIKADNIVPYVTGVTAREWLSKFDINKYDVNSSAGVDVLKYRCAVSLMRSRNVDVCRKELHDYYYNKFQKHKQKLKENGYLITDI